MLEPANNERAISAEKVPTALAVFYGEERVGTIRDTSPLVFEYAASWLTRQPTKPLSQIPLQAGPISSARVEAYFENLLPEGELRAYIAEQRKASTLFGMLLEVAGDTAGAFVIVPEGQAPLPPHYEPTTWEAIAATLATKSASAIDLKGRGARISLAGAQDKASIAIFDDGLPQLPRGTAPSTHILKPDIRRLAKVRESAINETLIMRTAAHCGMPTAEVFYQALTRCCVVRRFDRVATASGLSRLVQYDLCQLAGIRSEKKYEKEGGPGLAQCAALIRKASSQPAVDLRNFVTWVFFNLFTGNNDSHAKNLSLYEMPGKGVILTPFYDLMCTRIYPGLSQDFAFEIGGESRPGAIGRTQIIAMAKALDMGSAFTLSIAKSLAERLPAALDEAFADIQQTLSPGGRVFAEKLVMWVKSSTKKTARRLEE